MGGKEQAAATRLEAMSLFRECPACFKVLRPRSLDPDESWKSLRRHIRDKAQGCAAHDVLRASIFGNTGRPHCPGCSQVFESALDAYEHFCAAQDEAHTADALLQQETEAQQRIAAAAARAEVRSQKKAEVRRKSISLFSAAKSGRTDEVLQWLAEGLDPNATHDDGYTPLMTASEAGHEAVVSALLDSKKCKINAQNSYGQSALCLAAIKGHLEVVLRLLQDDAIDVECPGGGLSVAEKARRAGFENIADILASAAKGHQVTTILQALTEGFASGDYDSMAQRIQALSNRLAVVPKPEEDELPGEITSDSMLCSVCLLEPIEVVVVPCFHACVCSKCDAALAAKAHRQCPICRGNAKSTHRLFFP